MHHMLHLLSAHIYVWCTMLFTAQHFYLHGQWDAPDAVASSFWLYIHEQMISKCISRWLVGLDEGVHACMKEQTKKQPSS